MAYKRMTPTELAKAMIEYEELALQLENLREKIVTNVLLMEKTHTVGSVKATYNKGRTKYDYEEAAKSSDKVTDAIRMEHTTSTTKTNWRAVCNDAGLSPDEVPSTQSEPSVTLKIARG